MKLSEFILRLKGLEMSGAGDLPVALEDWQEDYSYPSEECAERVVVVEAVYNPSGDVGNIFGRVVVIGRRA